MLIIPLIPKTAAANLMQRHSFLTACTIIFSKLYEVANAATILKKF
jgi:hypothetical protein